MTEEAEEAEGRRKTVEMLTGHMMKAPVWLRRGAQKVRGGVGCGGEGCEVKF